MISDDIYIKRGYVEVSTYRKRVLKAIGEDVKIPTQIAKDSGIRTNHISKTLSELKKENLATCINEEAKKGRLYKLTPLGIKILKMIK